MAGGDDAAFGKFNLEAVHVHEVVVVQADRVPVGPKVQQSNRNVTAQALQRLQGPMREVKTWREGSRARTNKPC